DGLLSGLEAFGFNDLDGMDLFGNEKKKAEKEAAEKVLATKAPQYTEKDFLLDKTYTCPICDSQFKSRAVKASSTKLVSTEMDLRPHHAFVDVTKYDAIMCPMCGYTALIRYFNSVLESQKKNIREKVCKNFKMHAGAPEVFSYDDAIERFKMALLNAVVKGAKNSEKAYICLKTSWMYRGKAETVGVSDPTYGDIKAIELEFTKNAYEGFVQAVATENFPMCGMDEITVDYLIGVLAFYTEHYDVSSKMIGKVLTNQLASPRIKEKTRDLKEEVLKKLKNN
ncbi:MAG: DUF2225 domain-containing protein, partial [Lachnospiraceae bacterium]|nr:DUF2225 domain-containing protein [Lachnospiraceae bacterium]